MTKGQSWHLAKFIWWDGQLLQNDFLKPFMPNLPTLHDLLMQLLHHCSISCVESVGSVDFLTESSLLLCTIHKDHTADEPSPKCQCRLNHLNPFLASKKHCSRTVRATEIAWHHGHPGWNQEQGAKYEWCFWRWKDKASIIVPVRNGEDQVRCTMWAWIELKILRNRSHQKPFLFWAVVRNALLILWGLNTSQKIKKTTVQHRSVKKPL